MTSTNDTISHEQKLYLLWLADGPQPATAHHPDLSSTDADIARRKLLGRGLIHATQGGFWRLTDAGKAWVEGQRS